MREVTEWYCHDCGGYIRVALDMSVNGNHVVDCPKCGHEHCRVVKDGKVTGDRWERRNGTVKLQPTMSNYHTTSMYAPAAGVSSFATEAWAQTTCDTAGGSY